MLFAINLDENFVQMPLPIRVCAHPADPVFPGLRGEYRTEPVPPKPHRLVAYVDAAFMQKILHVSELKWKPHVPHHRQFDDLRARLEVLEHVGNCHDETLIQPPARFKLISSDSTVNQTNPGPSFMKRNGECFVIGRGCKFALQVSRNFA